MAEAFSLLPPPGIVTDETTYSTPGRWTDCNNVRFKDGRPEVSGGYTEPFAQKVAAGTSPACLLAASSASAIGIYFMAASRLKVTVFAGDGSVYYNNTPAGWGPTSDTIDAAPWGEDMILGGVLETLYYYDASAATLTEITNAPDSMSHFIVTPERQVLAIGCNEEVSGVVNNKCIRGCDLEDYTDWTTTASNNAFEHIVESRDNLTAGRVIGSYVAVWTYTELFLGQFLGNPGQTYRFDKISDNSGAMSQKHVKVINQIAYWFDLNQKRFWRWSPGGIVDQLECPVFDDVLENVTDAALLNAFCFYDAYNHEFQFFYRDSRDGTGTSPATRFIAYCVNESAKAGFPVWYRGTRTMTAGLNHTDSFFNFPAGLIGIGYNTASPASGHPVLSLENGSTANGAAMSWHIQSSDIYIDDGRRSVLVDTIYPDFRDQVGDVSLTVYTKQRPQSAAVTKGPFTLGTSTTKKNFRASGNLVSVKFSGGSASGSFVRFGKPSFDYKITGSRP